MPLPDPGECDYQSKKDYPNLGTELSRAEDVCISVDKPWPMALNLIPDLQIHY